MKRNIIIQNIWQKLNRKLIIDVVSLLFILLWVYASTAKLSDIQKFHDQISQSVMLSFYAKWLVILIPGIEYLFAILLITDKYRLFALQGSFGLISVFSTYIVLITNFSDFTPCSCGGVLEKMSWNQHLVFNTMFAIAAFLAILIYPSSLEK